MSGILKKIAAFVAALGKKYWSIIIGAGAYHTFIWIFDNPIWMAVELRWYGTGIICMMIGAFVMNTAFLVIFRDKQTDFILWSTLDKLTKKETKFNQAYDRWAEKHTIWRLCCVGITYIPVKLALFVLWCLKKSPRFGDVVAILVLSLIENPFVTTMYLRHGYRNGLRARDIAVYLVSSVISIGYWAVRNGVIVEAIIRPSLNIF